MFYRWAIWTYRINPVGPTNLNNMTRSIIFKSMDKYFWECYCETIEGGYV